MPIAIPDRDRDPKERAAQAILGGYPFISKPVTPERLAESIERHLHPAA